MGQVYDRIFFHWNHAQSAFTLAIGDDVDFVFRVYVLASFYIRRCLAYDCLVVVLVFQFMTWRSFFVVALLIKKIAFIAQAEELELQDFENARFKHDL